MDMAKSWKFSQDFVCMRKFISSAIIPKHWGIDRVDSVKPNTPLLSKYVGVIIIDEDALCHDPFVLLLDSQLLLNLSLGLS